MLVLVFGVNCNKFRTKKKKKIKTHTHYAGSSLTSISLFWSVDILYEPRPRLSIRSRPRGPCFFSNVSRNLAPSLGLNAMKRMTGCSAGSPYARAMRNPKGVSPSVGAASAPPSVRTRPAPVNTTIAAANVCASHQEFIDRLFQKNNINTFLWKN